MRILQVTDCYPPPLVGGRDRLVQMLSRELAQRDHEVAVVTLAGASGERVEHDGSIQVHRIAGWSRALSSMYVNQDKPFHPTLPDPGIVRKVAAIIRDFRPQVVHAHSWLLYSLLPLFPMPDCHLVVWLHDQGLICPKTTFLHRGNICSGPQYTKCVRCATEQYGAVRSAALTSGMNLMRPWNRRVDRFVANSRATANDAGRRLVPGGAPIEVIPPFVVETAFDAHRSPRPDFVPPQGDYLMFAGALSPHKGLDVLIAAWERLEPRVPLVLAGIRLAHVPTRIPPGVLVTEEVRHEDVLRGWAHCAAAVVPSVWPEPFGMVALEAMAAGRPVIAADVGGLPELVRDGETGVLVPRGDVSALRNAIQRLLADPNEQMRMGANGRARAKNYSAEAIVGAWERVFDDVISSPRRTSDQKGAA